MHCIERVIVASLSCILDERLPEWNANFFERGVQSLDNNSINIEL